MVERTGFDPSVRQQTFTDSVPSPAQAAEWAMQHDVVVDRSREAAPIVGDVSVSDEIVVVPSEPVALETGGRSGLGVVVLDGMPPNPANVIGSGYEQRGKYVAPVGSFGPKSIIG